MGTLGIRLTFAHTFIFAFAFGMGIEWAHGNSLPTEKFSAESQSIGSKGLPRKFRSSAKNTMPTPTLVREIVVRLEETPDELLVLFRHYESFYRWSKMEKNILQVQEYLREKIRRKKAVVAEIDPITTQILTLRDP